MKIKKEILLVDDDLDILDSLSIILKSNGYSVQTAINGQEALKSLITKKPDLMILDIMMTTETEGFDLAYELKNKPEFENLPVIIMSSFLDKVRESGPEAFQHILGEEWPAKWLFEKPVETDKLLAKIEAILDETNIS
ncbi:response regulator [bacterium]|nr:response regulator [bacterium]